MIVEELRDEADLVRGRITIACIPTFVSRVLPPMMVALKKQHPGIALRVLDTGSSSMIAAVTAGEVDLGIGPLPESESELDLEPLLEDSFVAVVPAGHELAGKSKIRLDELAEYPFIGLKSGHSVLGALERAAAEAGTPLKMTHALVYHHSVGSMVQAGLGVTAVPSMAVPLLNFPDIVAIPIDSQRLVRKVGVLRRKGGGSSPAVKKFLALLFEMIGSLETSTTQPAPPHLRSCRRV